MKQNQILDLLRENKRNFLSGEEISKSLKVSRTAVWKEIEGLRKLGYDIQAQPRLGYQLTAVPDKMFADEIQHGLKTALVGKRIFSYDEIGSTNDAAWKLGIEGLPDGTCVFAEHQTKGRGRLGRRWQSPKSENLILSMLLRPSLAPQEVTKITLMTAVAAVKAIRVFTSENVGIKWPNDLLYQGKKLAGILTEMNAESDRVNFVVAGIGLNLNSEGKDLPPASVSLKQIEGHAIPRQEFARIFLETFEKDYLLLKKGDFLSLARDWENFSATSGKRVTVHLLGRQIHGQAQGIDVDGALWVRTDNGLQEKILAGDIEHLR